MMNSSGGKICHAAVNIKDFTRVCEISLRSKVCFFERLKGCIQIPVIKVAESFSLIGGGGERGL